MPELETIITRDAGRTAEVKMGEDTVRTHYEYFSISDYFNEFAKLDTAKQTVDETVKDILQLLK